MWPPNVYCFVIQRKMFLMTWLKKSFIVLLLQEIVSMYVSMQVVDRYQYTRWNASFMVFAFCKGLFNLREF